MGEEEKSTAATEQQEKNEIVPTVGWYRQITYDDAKNLIRENIVSMARSFIAVGYYLKVTRDAELYREDHYANIWDFAYTEFGLSKSAASRYMNMNDRFSLKGNSPVVDQKYKDFSKSKLQEMLSLTDEQLEQVTPEMKVQEIRAMRQPKEIPYFELEGQMDLETDFPEIMPEMPATMQQPATIQTIMTIEEMMGGMEPEEQPEKLSAYGTPKRVYSEDSLLAEPSCEGGHYCFSCAKMDCDIRGKNRNCWYAPCGNPFACEIVVDGDLDLLTEQLGACCQFVNHDLAYHYPGTGEAAPCCCRCKNPCEWACERATAEKGEPEVVATSQQETPSTVLETDAQPSESAAEKHQVDENLEEPETAGMAEEPSEYDRDTLKGMIRDAQGVLAQMRDYWIENQPYTYAKYCMMIRAYEMLLQAQDAADQEPEPVVQPELPALRNNEQRAAFIDNYESWPLWIETQETGERYYRYDLPDGISFVIRTYHHMQPDYVSGIGVRYTEGYGANEQYILEPGKFFRNCQSNRSSMIEKLKELQKGEK